MLKHAIMENFDEEFDELIGNASALLNEIETNTSPPSTSPSSTLLSTRPRSRNRRSFSPTLQDLELNIQSINQYCDEVNSRLGGLTSPTTDNTSNHIDLNNSEYFTPPMNRRNILGDVVPDVYIDLSDTTPTLPVPFNIPRLRANEVIIVDDVVDLCSPARPPPTSVSASASTVSVAAINDPIRRRMFAANPNPRRRASTAPLPQREREQSSGVSTKCEVTKTEIGTVPLMCPICMESAANRQPTSTKCGHVFCNSCILEAIRITKKCPLCNTKLSKRTLVRLYL